MKQTFRNSLLIAAYSFGVTLTALPVAAFAQSLSGEAAFQQAKARLMEGGISNSSGQISVTVSGQSEDGQACSVQIYGLSQIADFADSLSVTMNPGSDHSMLFDIESMDHQDSVKVLENSATLLGLQVESTSESMESADLSSGISIPFMASKNTKFSLILETENSKISAITVQEDRSKVRCQLN